VLTKKYFIISVAAFIIGAAIAVIIVNINYSTNFISIMNDLGFK